MVSAIYQGVKALKERNVERMLVLLVWLEQVVPRV